MESENRNNRCNVYISVFKFNVFDKEIKEATDVYNEVTTNMQEINAAIRREEFLHDIATLKSRGLKEGLEQRQKRRLRATELNKRKKKLLKIC